jgi:hypothetical protein
MMTMHPRTIRHVTMDGWAVTTRLAPSSCVLAVTLPLIASVTVAQVAAAGLAATIFQA